MLLILLIKSEEEKVAVISHGTISLRAQSFVFEPKFSFLLLM